MSVVFDFLNKKKANYIEVDGIKIIDWHKDIHDPMLAPHKDALNRGRVKYVTSIVSEAKRFYDEKNILSFENSGTGRLDDADVNAMVAPISDIDVDIKYNGATDDITAVVDGIDFASMLKRIQELHSEHFNSSMSKQFDTNIYCSNLSPVKALLPGIRSFDVWRQMVYAATRIDHAKENSYLSLLKQDRLALSACSDQIKCARRYGARINKMYSYANKLNQVKKASYAPQQRVMFCVNALFEAFSVAKKYEEEAYHSVGAVAHIVLKLQGLDRSLYLCSAIDNLGFLHTNSELAARGSPSAKKSVVKYVYRIFDALQEKFQDDVSLKVSQLYDRKSNLDWTAENIDDILEYLPRIDEMVETALGRYFASNEMSGGFGARRKPSTKSKRAATRRAN